MYTNYLLIVYVVFYSYPFSKISETNHQKVLIVLSGINFYILPL